MSSQSADQPAADQTPAPIGMRELPPQPAKPVMPAYTMPSPTPLPAPRPAASDAGPGPDDSVIARDDHFEGTFTSRGTVCVMGSVKGRIEAVRVRIEDGARVDADVIVDEAIIAGEFTGNLTCRERLEAQTSGRINGRVETFRLMLHEGASVEGEMHMLTEAPRDASTTIRGSAPLRGEDKPEARVEVAGATASGARPPSATPPATRSAPSVAPASVARTGSSTAKPSTSAVTPAPSSAVTTTSGSTPLPGSSATTTTVTSTTTAGPEAALTPRRSPVAEALRLESLHVAPRTMGGAPRHAGPTGGSSVSTASRTRNGTTTGF
jgi:cytoskeletal protein CcmA (bactofilin family)